MQINPVIKIVGCVLFLLASNVQAGPTIEYWNTENGARVYFVRTQGLPMVDIRLMFDAGSARDGDKFGLAALTSALLDTGAGDWNADAIAQRLESVGAQLGTGAARDSAWLSLRSLNEPKLFNFALSTVSKILSSPSFNTKDFERDKKRVLVGLRQREEAPAAIASVAYFKALYGDHPYAHPSSGEIETVNKIERIDLIEFYRTFYVAKNAIIVIVGDVTRSKAEAITDQLLSELPTGERAPDLPEVKEALTDRSVSIAFPSTQTHIFSGVPSLIRGDPDYFALYVGNHILGGSGLVSRISEEVREKRGLSYHAYSYFSPMKRKGPFTMGLQTRNDQANEALQVLTQTLDDFIRNGPTPEELEAAKKNITGGFVLRIDSNKKLCNYVAMIGFYEMPLDYLDTFAKKVSAVSRQDIINAFRNRVQPNQFNTILVGGNNGSESLTE